MSKKLTIDKYPRKSDFSGIAVLYMMFVGFWLVPACSVQAQTGSSLQKNTSGDFYTYTWQSVTFHKNTLVKIGHHPLSPALLFPADLRPVGGKGVEVVSQKSDGKYRFILYYSAGQETQLRHWLFSLEQHFPVTDPTFRVVRKPYTHIGGRSWHYSITAANHTARISIGGGVWLFSPSQLQAYGEIDDPHFVLSMLSPESPIKQAHHFESITIVYSPTSL